MRGILIYIYTLKTSNLQISLIFSVLSFEICKWACGSVSPFADGDSKRDAVTIQLWQGLRQLCSRDKFSVVTLWKMKIVNVHAVCHAVTF
jgi:hypothetical protein